MTDITISTTDLRALLDVTEGYTSEHGLDSVNRYAAPVEVERAIINASAKMREVDTQTSARS